MAQPTMVNEQALIFTDADHRAIFISDALIKMLNLEDVGLLVGEHLGPGLGAEAGIVEKLLNGLSPKQGVHNYPLSIQKYHRGLIKILLSAIGNFDDFGNYVGADVILTTPGSAVDAGTKAHSDSIQMLIEQTLVGSKQLVAKSEVEQQRYIQSAFFKSKLHTLYVLLFRMDGPRVAETMTVMLNRTAEKNRWPISMQGQLIHLADSDPLPAETLRTLLDAVMDYAINVTSYRLVIDEVTSLENGLSAEVKNVVRQARLLE